MAEIKQLSADMIIRGLSIEEIKDILKQKTTYKIKGDFYPLLDNTRPRICIIGSRDICANIISDIHRMVEVLSRREDKPIILSGLAVGTDTAAHKAALEMGLTTYAVMAQGIDSVYPYQNRGLADAIIKAGGGLITAFDDGISPMAVNFLERTKQMVTMSNMVIIAAAREKGSSIVAAKYAVDLDIPVYALPGQINDPHYKGSNKLIYSGDASLLYDYEQLLNIHL